MYDTRLEPVLLDVQKPGRYVGGELNSVVKNKEEVEDLLWELTFQK